ncbi:MAG: ATP synthase F1 subunit delta [Oscillospiraceae bacterium]
MSNTASAAVYAKALYQACTERGDETACYQFALQFEKAFLLGAPLKAFLSSPSVTQQQREFFLDQIMPEKYMFCLRSAVKLMCRHSLGPQIPDMLAAFIQLYQATHQILPIKAVTAVPLSQRLQNKLSGTLQHCFGKTIALTWQTNPACIGGIRLYVQGRLIDATLQTRLAKIADALAGAPVFPKNFTSENEELV